SYLLRYGNDEKMQNGPVYSGSAKRPGYHYPKSMVAGDYLYVAYATNKEDVQYTRVPLANIQLNALASVDGIEAVKPTISLAGGNVLSVTQPTYGNLSVSIYTISGVSVMTHSTVGDYLRCDLTSLPSGIYIVRVNTDSGTYSQRIMKK
ncbi:MAG: T9SS type A sorting domain-containing protein, partial [Prevotella sp.]|nr:T9SS type A sorting domain-containing protein [Prevotella sp.]